MFIKPKKSHNSTGFQMPQSREELMRQVQQMQEKAKNTVVTGSSNQNLVKITLNGNREMLSVQIDSQCLTDPDGLQDMILQAHANALKALDDAH